MERILVIDDDKFVRNSLALTLEWAGYDVLEVANSLDGLACHQQDPVSLVVADDINAYEDQGGEHILALRHYSPGLPIIAISGTIPSRDQEQYSLSSVLGPVFHLQKPFTVDELLATIQMALPSTSIPEEERVDIFAVQR